MARRHRPSIRFTLAVLKFLAVLIDRSSWYGGTVPGEHRTPTADVGGRQHLRSASQRKLIVPARYRLNTCSFGRRCGVLLLRVRRAGIR